MDLVKLVFGHTPLYPSIRNFQHLLEAIFAVLINGYPARDLIVIGVTGTDGKTTVVHLIGKILKVAGYKTAIISSIGAFTEDKSLDTGLHVTTPDPFVLQPLLKKFNEQGITHVVLEATSHGLDQHRVFGCNFKIGVLTNITHEHLDYHKTFKRYRAAKAKLFQGVKVAVLNRDDSSFDYIRKVASRARIISYGTKHGTIVSHSVYLKPYGTEFVAREGKKDTQISTKLVGHYNILNVLAAVGAARSLKVPWDKIKNAMAEFPSIPGRMEEVKNNKGFRVIVDFAHTPNALKVLFATFKKTTKGKTIAVFGSAGERDKKKRILMGGVAAKYADFSVLTAEDPRSEDVEKIIDDITRGIRQGARVWDGVADWRKGDHWCIRVSERGEAIAFAIQRLAQKGDVIAICGKGHEKSMAYDHMEYPWSDQEAAREALKGQVKRINCGHN